MLLHDSSRFQTCPCSSGTDHHLEALLLLSWNSDCCPLVVQSEYGDLYKVTLAYSGDTVTELKIKYFDTIPTCTSICVLKTGFLFAASEFGNHALYQFLVWTPSPWLT